MPKITPNKLIKILNEIEINMKPLVSDTFKNDFLDINNAEEKESNIQISDENINEFTYILSGLIQASSTKSDAKDALKRYITNRNDSESEPRCRDEASSLDAIITTDNLDFTDNCFLKESIEKLFEKHHANNLRASFLKKLKKSIETTSFTLGNRGLQLFSLGGETIDIQDNGKKKVPTNVSSIYGVCINSNLTDEEKVNNIALILGGMPTNSNRHPTTEKFYSDTREELHQVDLVFSQWSYRWRTHTGECNN